ncbi:DoxX family protein [candidate division KSB1 bacterium]|nr:DoxX family protein [candidate division KSB1 bacterium]
MSQLKSKFVEKSNLYAPLLIRLMVGLVFLSEGVQKFLFPAICGAGRFTEIGLPASEFLGTFVASFEVGCGVLVLLGLCTRYASIPLVIIMLVAIVSTKIPILLNDGFWSMAHAARTDWSMLLGSIYLLLTGAGKLSLDAVIQMKTKK